MERNMPGKVGNGAAMFKEVDVRDSQKHQG